MKLNKIFMALAAMTVVGCSSDDLNVLAPEQQAAEDARLVELDPNFVIAGVGAEDNGTRTHWEWDDPVAKTALVNKFLPIYTVDPSDGDPLIADIDPTAQAVGLCWLGNGTLGTDVYTNYQFYHYGWLNKGQTEAKIECDELTNGAFYGEVTLSGITTEVAGDEADDATFTLTAPKDAADLNYNSGVYKTDNKSIFGGEYIVYYPFDDTFENAGTIPAKAQTVFGDITATTPTYVPTSLDDPMLGQTTFRYSSPVEIKGGAKASKFGLYNLSSLVQVRVVTSATGGAPGDKIDQIVLYSKKEQLLKQVNLAADKIVAGKKGVELYSEKEGEKVGTKTIVANFGPTLASDPTSYPQLDATTPINAFITVLPTTVEDLVVLVHNYSDGTWARIKKSNTEFKPGEGKRLDITVADADFKADYIAVDESSLTTALNEARTAIGLDASFKPTIEVIGDITLATTPYDIAQTATDPQITISGGDIIVPENVQLNVKTNMQSKVRVLGKSCCTSYDGGKLFIYGGTLNNVTMEPTKATVTDEATYDAYNPLVVYAGAATIAAGKTFDVQAGRLQVKNPVQHKGNINIAEGAKVTVYGTETGDDGDLNFMGSTVVNDGTIEVLKGGKFDMTAADGGATAADGKRMTNSETGKFIHNVDAAVGTAVQSMNQNGEYRCRVDAQKKLDDAYQQWTACSVIEILEGADNTYNLVAGKKNINYKHNNKYIDIEVNTTSATTFDNPIANTTTGAGDNENIQIGNLTVTAGGLDINYLRYKVARTLTVNGDMTVKATTNINGSELIDIKKNLTVQGATLKYKGYTTDDVLNNKALTVAKNITVSDGTFDADDVNALEITCANFSLVKVATGATAKFGNRTNGDAKTMTVKGTISNPKGCEFNIHTANQDGAGSVLAWIDCYKLTVGGEFPGGKPKVVAKP